MRPGPEVKALQDRLNKLLPRIEGDSPVRPVKILVQTGNPPEIVNVNLSYAARGESKDAESGKGLVLSRKLSELTALPDLALADFLAGAVKRLLNPE
jgi:hypothetical protein